MNDNLKKMRSICAEINNYLNISQNRLESGDRNIKALINNGKEINTLLNENNKYFEQQQHILHSQSSQNNPFCFTNQHKELIDLWACPISFGFTDTSPTLYKLSTLSNKYSDTFRKIKSKYNQLTKVQKNINIELSNFTDDNSNNNLEIQQKQQFDAFRWYSQRVITFMTKTVLESVERVSKQFIDAVRTYANNGNSYHYNIGYLTIYGPVLCMAIETQVSASVLSTRIFDTQQYLKSHQCQDDNIVVQGRLKQTRQKKLDEARWGFNLDQKPQIERRLNCDQLWTLDRQQLMQLNVSDYSDMQDQFSSRRNAIMAENQDQPPSLCLCSRYTDNYTIYGQYSLETGRRISPDKYVISEPSDNRDELHTIVLPTVHGFVFQISLLQRKVVEYSGSPLNHNQITGSPDMGGTIQWKLTQLQNPKNDTKILERLLSFYQQLSSFEYLGIGVDTQVLTQRRFSEILQEDFNDISQEMCGSQPRRIVSAITMKFKPQILIKKAKRLTDQNEPTLDRLQKLCEQATQHLKEAEQFEVDAYQALKTFEQLKLQLSNINQISAAEIAKAKAGK